MKDVVVSDSGPKTLLLQKHADYIAAYGSKKDDYVRIETLKKKAYSFLHDAYFCVFHTCQVKCMFHLNHTHMLGSLLQNSEETTAYITLLANMRYTFNFIG